MTNAGWRPSNVRDVQINHQWDGDQALKRALTVKPKAPISSVFQRQDVENNRMPPMTPRLIIISDINGLNHALGLYLCVYFINSISADTFTSQIASVPHWRYQLIKGSALYRSSGKKYCLCILVIKKEQFLCRAVQNEWTLWNDNIYEYEAGSAACLQLAFAPVHAPCFSYYLARTMLTCSVLLLVFSWLLQVIGLFLFLWSFCKFSCGPPN